MSKDKATPQQHIIFDTNIIHYLADKNAVNILAPYIIELSKRGFNFAISEITIFEILRGTYNNKEKELIELLNLFQRYFVNNNVLLASAQLETLYKIDQIAPQSISDGDKIIGSTSILTGSLIFTANLRDFPLPFFKELERKCMDYVDKKGKNRHILVGILAPDHEVINKKFAGRPEK